MLWSLKYRILARIGLVSESQLAKCSEPDNPEQSILFIGNSFTYYSSMPCIFYKQAGERIPGIERRVFFQGGGGLKLWHHAGSQSTRSTLMNSGRWDIVVLQEQSQMTLNSDTLKTMREGCKWFADAIHKVGGNPVLLMTWCDLENPQDQPTISNAYREIGREIEAAVIPAGDLFLEVTSKDKSIMLYDPDGHHPSYHGSFLVACLSEALLLHSKDELMELVQQNQVRTAAVKNLQEGDKQLESENSLIDPQVERKLQAYADDLALREISAR